jgi:hypothetical protein
VGTGIFYANDQVSEGVRILLHMASVQLRQSGAGALFPLLDGGIG